MQTKHHRLNYLYSILPGRISLRFLKVFCQQNIKPRYAYRLLIWLTQLIIFSPFCWLETVLYDYRIRKHKPVQNPIIILGHWRSGTTFLQELLATDPKLTYLNVYKATFPYCFHSTERFIKPILQFLFNLFKTQHTWHRRKLNMNIPAEEEFAMQWMFNKHSLYWGHVFPKVYNTFLQESLADSSKLGDNTYLGDWQYLTQKLSLHSKKRLLLKNPPATFHIKSILSVYPNAKFIFLHRNPYDTYYSTVNLWKANRPFLLQDMPIQDYKKMVLDSHKAMHESYINNRENIPFGNLMEVSFNELTQQPEALLRHIYDRFLNTEVDPKNYTSFLAKIPYKQKKYTYKPNDVADINLALSQFFTDFNYTKKDAI